MRDPHVRFCERHGRAISRAYSTHGRAISRAYSTRVLPRTEVCLAWALDWR
jgi:hypothetical protein